MARSSSALSAGPPRFTAIVISVSSPNVGAIGTGFKTPPSTKSTPLYLYGVNRSGIEIDALIAPKRLPDFIHISFCPFTSVATAVYERGRSSINCSPTNLIKVSMILSPLTKPLFSHERSSNEIMLTFVMERTHCSYSLSFPAAYIPPISAPIEEPAIDLILKSFSSSQ